MISNMGMGDKIASVTTINTPHHGSITVDKLLVVPDVLIRIGCKCTDLWMRILGDKKPDTEGENDGISDIVDFYEGVVRELAEMGY